jgi:hypothetical protein
LAKATKHWDLFDATKTNLAALFCTFSRLPIFFRFVGSHTELAYSIVGLTIYVYAADFTGLVQSDRLYQERTSSEAFGNSFFPKTIRDWNQLPANTTPTNTVEGFRSAF